MGEPFPHGTQQAVGSGSIRKMEMPNRATAPPPSSLQKAKFCPQVFLHNAGMREEKEQLVLGSGFASLSPVNGWQELL